MTSPYGFESPSDRILRKRREELDAATPERRPVWPPIATSVEPVPPAVAERIETACRDAIASGLAIKGDPIEFLHILCRLRYLEENGEVWKR